MKIDIVGAGSIGMLLAGKLCRTSTQVRLISRTEEQTERLSGSGITVWEADGSSIGAIPLQALSIQRYSELAGEFPDWILLTVKQKDIDESLLQILRGRCGSQTYLCCFQNGIGHLEKLGGIVGDRRLAAAITTEGAGRKGPAELVHTGKGVTRLGYSGQENSACAEEKLEALVFVLKQAGFQTELSNSIDIEIWNKLLINVVVNPLTAILQVTNGALLQSEFSLRLMRQLYDEGVELARRLHIGVADNLWDRLLEVCRATAVNRSSMLQDLDAGRPTELEWLNGSLLREADRLAMKLPVHRTVYELVKCREQQAIRNNGAEGRSGS